MFSTYTTRTMESKSQTTNSDLAMAACSACFKPKQVRKNVTSCRCRNVVYCDVDCRRSHAREHSDDGCKFMQEKFSRTRLYLSKKSHTLGVEAVLNELVSSFQHNGTLEDLEQAQLSSNRADFFRQIERMQRKTALMQGDRSYPDLQLLDSHSFMFPTWREDVAELEQKFVRLQNFTGNLETLVLKQDAFAEANPPNEWKAGSSKQKRAAGHKYQAHLRKIEHEERLRQYDEAECHDAGVEAVLARIVSLLTYEERFDDIRKATLAFGRRDFFKELEKIVRKEALFAGDRSFKDLQLLDSHVFTYEGAEKDIASMEYYWSTLLIGVEKSIAKSCRSQAVFDGDRSHPNLVDLDEFMATATCPNLSQDYAKAVYYHLEHIVLFEGQLKLMKKKQRMYELSSTSPNTKLANLTPAEKIFDRVSQALTYPDAGQDIENGALLVEESKIQNIVAIMRRKQNLFDGDRSFKDLQLLDSHVFTYEGAEKDIASMEYYWSTLLIGVEKSIAKSCRSQAVFDGDRSHPNLVDLDEFMATATCPNLSQDYAKAVYYHLEHIVLFEGQLKLMKKKQRMYELSSTSPNTKLANLTPAEKIFDRVSQALTYPDAGQDIENGALLVEESKIQNIVAIMRRKQNLFDGDRSSATIVKLDNLISTLTHPERDADRHSMERTWCMGWSIDNQMRTTVNKQQQFDGTSESLQGPDFQSLNKFLQDADYPYCQRRQQRSKALSCFLSKFVWQPFQIDAAQTKSPQQIKTVGDTLLLPQTFVRTLCLSTRCLACSNHFVWSFF